MSIDPQAAVPISVVSVLIVVLGQLVTYFTKQSREPENGVKNQVKTNSENIKNLEEQIRDCVRLEAIRSVERDLRDGMRRLGTLEEQVKNNIAEIGYMRPRFHQVINEQSSISKDVGNIGKDVARLLDEERQRRNRP